MKFLLFVTQSSPCNLVLRLRAESDLIQLLNPQQRQVQDPCHWKDYTTAIALVCFLEHRLVSWHYNDVIMSAMASQITSLTIVYSSVYSDADQRRTSKLRVTSLCVRGIHRWSVNSLHKGPATRKWFHLMTSSCAIQSAVMWLLKF